MTEKKRPVLNKTSFPNASAMTEYGHAHNLTLGWYSNNIGCAAQEAGWSSTPELHQRHYEGVADFLAASGFDEMKVDSGGMYCAVQFQNHREVTISLPTVNTPFHTRIPFDPNVTCLVLGVTVPWLRHLHCR